MRELLAELKAALEERRDCVYCSLVETRGSTPQKAGAAMLVFPDGSQRGTLGGGCVEAEVKQRALQVLQTASDVPHLLTFQLDDDYGWDDGLICGGRMTVVADPLTRNVRSPAATAYYTRLHDLVEKGVGCTEAVIVSETAGVGVGQRFLFDAEGRLALALGNCDVAAEVAQNLTPLHKRPQAGVRNGVAYLPILPRVTLLIVGGGHVGQAVARLAADVDFDICVLDDREHYVNRERFPAARRIVIGDIGRALQQLAIEITPATYCLIVTRGHAHDEEALYHLANTPAGYVGMIGSKRKIRLIFEDLVAKGISEETLKKVHAPLGFSIGSQTVPEIAVSIVAELIACRNLGGTLREARAWVSLGKGGA
jgi:xanthine dehydrogenase accessory factor